jgi:hypothetical protein
MSFHNKAGLTQIVRECVNAYDSEHLLRSGAPLDEYEPEIAAIVHELNPGTSVLEAWLIICNTLHWFFHAHDQPVLYWNKHRELAEAIVSRLPEVDRVEP